MIRVPMTNFLCTIFHFSFSEIAPPETYIFSRKKSHISPPYRSSEEKKVKTKIKIIENRSIVHSIRIPFLNCLFDLPPSHLLYSKYESAVYESLSPSHNISRRV